MNWALRQTVGGVSAKSVLLILANRADHEGRCFPGIDGIAGQTELARRTVIRSIKKLEEIGLVTIEHRGGDGGGRKSNRYRLNLDIEQSANLAPCQSDTGGQSDNDDRQCATVSKQCDTVTPEPKDNPKKNPKFSSEQKTSGTSGLLSDVFLPDQHTIDYAAIHSLPDPTDCETIEDFKLHYRANPRISADWQAMYCKWLRKKRVIDGCRPSNASGRKLTKFEEAQAALDAS